MARHCPRAAQVRPLILTEWRRWHAEQEARFAAERERHKSELVSATRGLGIAKLEAAAGALELALATERGKVSICRTR